MLGYHSVPTCGSSHQGQKGSIASPTQRGTATSAFVLDAFLIMMGNDGSHNVHIKGREEDVTVEAEVKVKRAMSQGTQQPLKAGKVQETDSLLEPTERNAAPLTHLDF